MFDLEKTKKDLNEFKNKYYELVIVLNNIICNCLWELFYSHLYK